jgi:hypothetical protein
MSFSRQTYDECAYSHALKESLGSGTYRLETPRVQCGNVFVPSPYVRLDRIGVKVCPDKMIDIDSELIGLNRKSSQCPQNKYIPDGKQPCDGAPIKETNMLDPEDTRLSNPACTLRGTGWNRWNWLCNNPQDKALVPFQHQINNRLIVKDNHRPCIARPMDGRDVLPPAAHERACASAFIDQALDKYPKAQTISSTSWRRADEILKY